MNQPLPEENLLIQQNVAEESTLTPLLPLSKLQGALALESGFDPLYAPLLQAAAALREKIESTHKAKIEDLKRDTANQTEAIYNKLTDAREEFQRLQDMYFTSVSEKELLHEEFEKKLGEEVILLNIKNDALIEKLKSKIDQIHEDYNQQLNNLQQKLNFQKTQLSDEIALLTKENDDLRNEQHGSSSLQEKLLALESENINLELAVKEKAEKLLRTEHNLKLAHEEVERNQQYIKALEEKNNTIQKELFENWILKKDEL